MLESVQTSIRTSSLLVLVLCLIFEYPQTLLSLLSPDLAKGIPLQLKAQEIPRVLTHFSHHVDNLSNTTGAFNPKFYTSGSNIDVVWENSDIVSSEILFKKSIDGGAGFGPEICLSKYEQHSVHPQISGSGSNLYVVWQHSDLAIVLRKSTDNGATFGPIEKVVDTTAYTQDLQVAAAGDNVYILWKDGSTKGIILKTSTDRGQTFGPPVKLSNITAAASDLKIAAAESNVYVVWKDVGLHNHYSILLRESTDGGISFRPSVKIR